MALYGFMMYYLSSLLFCYPVLPTGSLNRCDMQAGSALLAGRGCADGPTMQGDLGATPGRLGLLLSAHGVPVSGSFPADFGPLV